MKNDSSMLTFLTIQVFILVILRILLNVEFLNLHLLTILVLFGGSYLTYVKEFIVIEEVDITGHYLHLGNLLFHIIPFVLIWSTYKFKKNYFFETIIYVLVYIYMFNPKRKYYIIMNDFSYLMTVAIIIVLWVYICM